MKIKKYAALSIYFNRFSSLISEYGYTILINILLSRISVQLVMYFWVVKCLKVPAVQAVASTGRRSSRTSSSTRWTRVDRLDFPSSDGKFFLYIENPWLDQGFDKALAMSL